MTATELKEMLRQINNGEKDWQGEDENLLIASMIEHIGSMDSILRETNF